MTIVLEQYRRIRDKRASNKNDDVIPIYTHRELRQLQPGRIDVFRKNNAYLQLENEIIAVRTSIGATEFLNCSHCSNLFVHANLIYNFHHFLPHRCELSDGYLDNSKRVTGSVQLTGC